MVVANPAYAGISAAGNAAQLYQNFTTLAPPPDDQPAANDFSHLHTHTHAQPAPICC